MSRINYLRGEHKESRSKDLRNDIEKIIAQVDGT